MKIYTGENNTILRQVSTPVERITKDTVKLIRAMEETMEQEEGVGLAAPQVGVHQRIIVVAKVSQDEKEILGTIPMINPEITHYSMEQDLRDEGCLSLPGKFAKVRRHRSVTVRFLTPKGQERSMVVHGLTAQAVQHEIEHLDGILFTDHIQGPLRDVASRSKGEGFLV